MEKIEPRKLNMELVKVAVLVGTLAGIASLLYMLLLHGLGLHAFGKFKYMYVAIYGVFFAYAAWLYRDRRNNFRMKFREGIFLGFSLNLLATILYIGGLYLVMRHTTWGSEMLAIHQAKIMEIWKEADAAHKSGRLTDLTAEELQATYNNILAMKPGDLALDQITFFHFIGVFNTLLATMVLKR